MMKTLTNSAGLALMLGTAANAAILPQPLDTGDSNIVTAAEHCGVDQ